MPLITRMISAIPSSIVAVMTSRGSYEAQGMIKEFPTAGIHNNTRAYARERANRALDDDSWNDLRNLHKGCRSYDLAGSCKAPVR